MTQTHDTLRAFHALLTSLIPGAQPPMATRPPPPHEMLKGWNKPAAGADPPNVLTLWGTFLASQGLVENDDPILWSSINMAPLDPQRRLFDTVPDVLNWFAARTADHSHVEKIHSVVFDPNVRSKFLSGSFIAESLAKANRIELLRIPWLFLDKIDGMQHSSAAVIGLDASPSGQRLILRRPGGGDELLEEVLDMDERADAIGRYHAYINQIRLPNATNSARAAFCMLRLPAGWTMGGRQLIEFFHAFPRPPSDESVARVQAASEIAGAAVQSVLGPAIIRAVERAHLAGFFNSVVAHELETWRLNVEAGVSNIRHDLETWKPKPTRRSQSVLEGHLEQVDFDDAIFQRVLQGLAWAPRRDGTRSVPMVRLLDVISWVRNLRHPCLKDRRCEVVQNLNQATLNTMVPGETDLVLANLIRNAVAANQLDPKSPIRITFSCASNRIIIAVASKEPFDLGAWLKEHPDEDMPIEHRGIWLCRQMLKPLGSDLGSKAVLGFGCELEFSVPIG